MTNGITKDILVDYAVLAATEDGLLTHPTDAATVRRQLVNGDIQVFEAILKRRLEKISALAAESDSAKRLFSQSFYSGQADTIQSLISNLPRILA